MKRSDHPQNTAMFQEQFKDLSEKIANCDQVYRELKAQPSTEEPDDENFKIDMESNQEPVQQFQNRTYIINNLGPERMLDAESCECSYFLIQDFIIVQTRKDKLMN